MMKIGPESHSISHSDHLQSLAVTEKPDIYVLDSGSYTLEFRLELPDMIGPSAGPQVAASAQRPRTYGSLMIENMSPKEAPPVARQGWVYVSMPSRSLY